MLTDPDWLRLQQITRDAQLREAGELGLLNPEQIERRMRAGIANGKHPFKIPLKGYTTVEQAMERERKGREG